MRQLGGKPEYVCKLQGESTYHKRYWIQPIIIIAEALSCSRISFAGSTSRVQVTYKLPPSRSLLAFPCSKYWVLNAKRAVFNVYMPKPSHQISFLISLVFSVNLRFPLMQHFLSLCTSMIHPRIYVVATYLFFSFLCSSTLSFIMQI